MSNIIPISSLELDNVKFGKLHQTPTGLIRCDVLYNKYPLLITGPKMYLGADIIRNNGLYYIDLMFNEKSKLNNKLLNFVNSLESMAITNVYDRGKLWYRNIWSNSLAQIEHEWIPTIKTSHIYNDRKSLKLKSPINMVSFYDQDGVDVPYHLLKEHCEVIPLLQIMGIYKDSSHLWVEWNLVQLKADVSYVLKGCQLVDVCEDSSGDETIIEDAVLGNTFIGDKESETDEDEK
jgi:hypothetical protein